MRTTIIFSILSLLFFRSFAQDINPFESIGKEGKILTLSKGKYIEVENNDSLQRIGSVIVNRNTGQLYEILDTDTLYQESDLNPTIITRWWSVDPLAAKYPNMSPYAAVANNPIIYKDTDGRDFEIVIDDATHTITIRAKFYVMDDAETAKVVDQAIAEINSNSFVLKASGGVNYNVKFDLTTQYSRGQSSDEMKKLAESDDAANFINKGSYTAVGYTDVTIYNLSLEGNSFTGKALGGEALNGGDDITLALALQKNQFGYPTYFYSEMARDGKPVNDPRYNIATLIHEIIHGFGGGHKSMSGLNKGSMTKDVIKSILTYASSVNSDLNFTFSKELTPNCFGIIPELHSPEANTMYSPDFPFTYKESTYDNPSVEYNGPTQNINFEE